jgi:alkanesulfonate monooxygenase SsuD/methylene tetrahydromethanopterin reductase-like flavin-dependent oxidoreductase (luciferase family)
MKVIVWPGTMIRATAQERAALRPIGRDRERYGQMLEELEHLAVMADAAGLHGFGTTEHHLHTEGGESLPNALLFYAKLAARTRQLRFIPLSLVLPARDPIRTAEDLALFDQMYPGRIAACFARGYQTRWMQTLTQSDAIVSGPRNPVSNAINREIFDEHLEIMLKAWTEDGFSYDGEHYQVPYPVTGIAGWQALDWTREFGGEGEVDDAGLIRKVGVVPPPHSQPHPPVFVPYTLSEQTLDDAARRGFGVFIYDGRPHRFGPAAARYRDQARAHGRDLALGEGVVAVRKIFLGDSFEEAMDIATNTAGFWFHRYFSRFGFAEANRTDRDDPKQMVRFSSDRECAERMFETKQLLAGTPDEVADQLADLQRCHADGKLEYLAWEFLTTGTYPLEEQQRQMDLFANQVLPRFG